MDIMNVRKRNVELGIEGGVDIMNEETNTKGIKTLEQIKEEFKNTDKEKIIEMFYNQGMQMIKIANKLEEINDLIEGEGY